jgi:hypothetical protein
MERFKYGLHPSVRDRIACHKISVFTEMVDMVSITKRSVKEVIMKYAQRKQSASQPTYPAKRQATGSSYGAAVKRNPPPSHTSSRPECTKCGRNHPGECKMGNWSMLQAWQI